jgi:hypothetical protein
MNLCRSCNEDFSSVEAFDRHRVGRHAGPERRCLDTEELTAKGWVKNDRGRWVFVERALRATAHFETSRSLGLGVSRRGPQTRREVSGVG